MNRECQAQAEQLEKAAENCNLMQATEETPTQIVGLESPLLPLLHCLLISQRLLSLTVSIFKATSIRPINLNLARPWQTRKFFTGLGYLTRALGANVSKMELTGSPLGLLQLSNRGSAFLLAPEQCQQSEGPH